MSGRIALEALDELRARPWLAWPVGAIVAWLLAGALLPNGAPLGVVLTGAAFGTATALLAMGLILIYRATRIINFAQVGIGGVGGVLAVNLFLHQGWPYFLCLALGVIVGIGTGALVDVAVIRRFRNASRLLLTVATIGLAQVLGGLELLIPRWVGAASPLNGGYSTPLSSVHVNVEPVLITGDHLLIVAVVPIVIAVLAWFLLRTDNGVAVRAAAENGDRALMLGIPVRRLSTLVWAVAGGLSALTFLLQGPFHGATPDVLGGPTLLLPALAAAVIARMESLPLAFAAGVGLGILEQLVLWNSNTASTADVAFLVVILAALLVQRQKLSRAEEGDTSSWSIVSAIRPIPRELRHLPEVRAGRWALGALIVGFAVGAPFVYGPSTVNLMSVAIVWGIVAISLVVLTGWGGNISLGQFGFVGVGAMVTGNLVVKLNLDLFLCFVIAGAATAAVALLVGLPALRIRGLFLAVTTLAFAVALDSYFLNPVHFRNWVPEELTRPVLWQRFPLESERATYFLCLAFLVLAVGVALGVRRARSGRALVATRDNTRAAGAMAVPTTASKLSGFLLSGVIAGVAGGLHVLILHGARVGTYQPIYSLEVFSMAVIGGMGSVGGALLGVFTLRLIQGASDAYRLLVTGSGVLVILLVLPGGLGQAAAMIRDRVLRRVAERRGILVPSLVADRRTEDRPAEEAALLSQALEAEDTEEAEELVGSGR
ncbi:MAG: ABC transporter permease [Acidimicrobiia bacterium]|nr:ABC transporter permease [Acidimicrobiia bacterium]